MRAESGRGCRWMLCCLLAGRLMAQEAAPASPSVEPTTPHVQICVFYAIELGYSAVVAYDRPIPKETAIRDLTELATGLGYESIDALRRAVPGEENRRELAYSSDEGASQISFRLGERALDRQQGTLKLEPFIVAYREYGRIDLDVMVGDLNEKRFVYRGLRDYESPFVRIRHHGSGVSHRFQIEVLDASFEKLDLPPFAPPDEPLEWDQPVDRNRSGLREWVGLVALALGCAAVVFWLLSRRGRRRRRRRRRLR